MIRGGCIKELEGSAGRLGKIVNFAFAGELLGLQGVGSVVSRSTAIAVDPSFICVVPRSACHQMCAKSPRLARELIRLIVGAGGGTRDTLTMIRDKEAPARVAGFLLDVFSRVKPRGVAAGEFRLGMNRDDVADYLGLRSETVSRCLTHLSRRRLISVSAKRVEILDPGELRRAFEDG